MRRDISFHLPDRTITFEDVEPPDGNTPLPPTNAAIHLMSHEIGYGTPERRFIMLCGVAWNAKGSTGEHKYFFEGDVQWHKHINCPACLKLMQGGGA